MKVPHYSTLLALLIFILIIVVMAANPQKRFQEANSIQRKNDLEGLTRALKSYVVDNNNDLSSLSINESAQEMSNDGLDICKKIVPKYLSEMPNDPENGYYLDCSNYKTGYFVMLDGSNIVVK